MERKTEDRRPLGTNSSRGSGTLLTAQWARYGLQLGSLVVLARMLAPADFGVATMALAVVGVANVLGDFGLSLSAIRSRELSAIAASNLFWLNTGMGLAAAGVLELCAPYVAAFYGAPSVQPTIALMAIAFCANGAAVQFKVVLNRDHRYVDLAIAETAGPALGLAIAVVAAWMGAGATALALQLVLGAWVTLFVAAGRSQWRPALPARSGELGEHLRFGGASLLLQLANYVSANVDSVLVGRLLGAAVLGLYNRAFQLVALPIQQFASPLTRVFLPRLARAYDSGGFGDAVLAVQRGLALPLLAALSLLAATARPLLVVVFGVSWAPAAPLVEVLALGGAFQALGYVYYWAYLARGQAGRLFIVELPGRIVGVALMWLLLPLGAVGVAAGAAVVQIGVFAVVTVDGRRLGLRPGQMLRGNLHLLGVFGLAYFASFIAGRILGGGPVLWQLCGTSIAWAAVALSLLIVAPATRAQLLGYPGLVAVMLRRRRAVLSVVST